MLAEEGQYITILDAKMAKEAGITEEVTESVWTYIWRHDGVEDAVKYIDGKIVFPEKYLHPDKRLSRIDFGSFTGSRPTDEAAVRDYLKDKKIKFPDKDEYTLHHDTENGIYMFVKTEIHKKFTHLGGNSFIINRERIDIMLIRKNSNNQVEENIIKLEEKFDFKFPEMYKKFLLKYNGGDVDVVYNKEYAVGLFYKIEYFTRSERPYWYLDERIEQCVFPIATDVFGNEYFIVIIGEKTGQIYFLNPDKDEFEFIASDLKKFIDGCEDRMIYHPTPQEQEEGMIASGMGDEITDKLREEWNRSYEYYLTHPQEECILD